MKTIKTFFAVIKQIAIEKLSPKPISKKLHLVLSIAWIVIALTSIVAGIVIGLNISTEDSVGRRIGAIWLCASLCCIIPSLNLFLPQIVRSFKQGFETGKKYKTTIVTANEISSDFNSSTYQLSSRTEHKGWLYGCISIFIKYLILACLYTIIGLPMIITRSVLIVREIVKYLNSPREEAEA